MGADTDWDVMCSSVPVAIRPLTSTRTAGVYITSTSNTIDSRLGCRRHSTHKGYTVPVVLKLIIAPLLCNSKFQKLYLSDYMSAYYCYRYLWGRRDVEMAWEEKREKKTGKKLSVTMAACFFFFSAKSASEKCVFVNGAGCTADAAVLSELIVHFAALRIPFCASVKIREQRTITIISSQWIIRAAHTHRIQIRLVCCLYWKHFFWISVLAKNDFMEIWRPNVCVVLTQSNPCLD